MRIGGFAGPVTTTKRSDNAIALKVTATRPAMLVVSESWFPGWSALIDGKPAKVLRVDTVALGVSVPAGHHQVSLSYRAPGFRLGATVSAAALAGVAVTPLLLYLRRRRRDRKDRRRSAK